MEYTNDIILNVRYKKDESITYGKHRKLKRVIKKIKDDKYFLLTMVISVVALFIDYIIIKQFIEILNLL